MAIRFPSQLFQWKNIFCSFNTYDSLARTTSDHQKWCFVSKTGMLFSIKYAHVRTPCMIHPENHFISMRIIDSPCRSYLNLNFCFLNTSHFKVFDDHNCFNYQRLISILWIRLLRSSIIIDKNMKSSHKHHSGKLYTMSITDQ